MSEEQEGQKRILKDQINNIEYIRGRLLGTGGFAKCFEAIDQENQKIYAAKVIPKKTINEKKQRYKLLVEIKIHKSLKHRHIVEFIETFEDRENVYILLEYCRNYTLKDLVKRRKRISEYETKIYIQQVVKALIYIHSQSIIHRDLKLGNILINDEMDTKICDFGLSTRVKKEGEIKRTICGTPNYIAPEILEENGHSYEVDIWSIGVIMYTLLFGKPPFEDNTVEQTYENIKTNRFSYPPAIEVTHYAKDLINRILVTDPGKRISLEDILSHQFMKNKGELPRELPAYTLAVPPFKFMDIDNKRLVHHDENLELSQDNENYNVSEVESSFVKEKLELSIGKLKRPNLGVYIYECFFFEDSLGYLLSNGVVGAYSKKTGINVIFEYGSSNYYIVPKEIDKQPIRKSLPDNDFELESMPEYLQELLNFKSFFATKYGIFKLDQLHKEFVGLVSDKLREEEIDEVIYIKKVVKLQTGEIIGRLSNSTVQLLFNDFSSLTISKSDNSKIYLISSKGRVSEVDYDKCESERTKTKIRMFSNLMEKLSKKR